MILTRIFILIGATICLACESPPRSMIKFSTAFKNSNVVPDVISMVPPNILNVFYSSVQICYGTEIAQTQSILMPKITYSSQHDTYYSLFLVDADVPSHYTPSLRSALYWLVINIPGNDIEAGFTVTPYVPPIVYPDSGRHRFVVLSYAQDKLLDVTNSSLLSLATNRTRFSVSKFNKERNSTLEAGNFFTMRVTRDQNNYCKA